MKYDLGRFTKAQERDYDVALSEIVLMSRRSSSKKRCVCCPACGGIVFKGTESIYAISAERRWRHGLRMELSPYMIRAMMKSKGLQHIGFHHI